MRIQGCEEGVFEVRATGPQQRECKQPWCAKCSVFGHTTEECNALCRRCQGNHAAALHEFPALPSSAAAVPGVSEPTERGAERVQQRGTDDGASDDGASSFVLAEPPSRFPYRRQRRRPSYKQREPANGAGSCFDHGAYNGLVVRAGKHPGDFEGGTGTAPTSPRARNSLARQQQAGESRKAGRRSRGHSGSDADPGSLPDNA